MISRQYTPAVKIELERLQQVAIERSKEHQLRGISILIEQWKEMKLDAGSALKKIQIEMVERKHSWSNHFDPGVPVAQAFSEGLLLREELSDEIWSSIEFLVTLADI